MKENEIVEIICSSNMAQIKSMHNWLLSPVAVNFLHSLNSSVKRKLLMAQRCSCSSCTFRIYQTDSMLTLKMIMQ